MATVASSGERPRRRRFTLVEALTIVVVAGAIASFAVPRLISSAERTTAGEAFDFLAAVRESQDAHYSRTGRYCATLGALGVDAQVPRHFLLGAIAVPPGYGGFEDGWELTLTRSVSTAGHGRYTVTFDQDGYEPVRSTLPSEFRPSGR